MSGDGKYFEWLLGRGHISLHEEREYTGKHSISYYGLSHETDMSPSEKYRLKNKWQYALSPSVCANFLAHWMLQNRKEVEGKSALDLCAASGIVAIAAAKSGAKAATIDVCGAELVRRNAGVNGVSDSVSAITDNIFSDASLRRMQKADVIILSNYFDGDPQSNGSGRKIQNLLLEQARRGATVIVAAIPAGDGGWNMLIKHGEPIRPLRASENLFDPKISYYMVMFKVTQSSVKCG